MKYYIRVEERGERRKEHQNNEAPLGAAGFPVTKIDLVLTGCGI